MGSSVAEVSVCMQKRACRSCQWLDPDADPDCVSCEGSGLEVGVILYELDAGTHLVVRAWVAD